MTQKVFRTGNSLAVTIPAGFSSSVGVRPGDKVNVREDKEKGRIVYQFSGAQQLPLDEVFFKHKKRKNRVKK
ncbi:hypothetical protein CMO96_03940 [Candidatus Woesebacteria bacterium]|nr:hypothetical protein [Candidatus Woesebacteria bacterium]